MKIKTTYYSLEKQKQKRIVLLADIHFDKHTKSNLLDRLQEKIKSLKPNIICIAGDLLDSGEVTLEPNMKKMYSFLRTLGTYATTLIVLGNHDNRTIQKGKVKPYEIQMFIQEVKQIPNVFLLQNETYKKDNLFFMGYEVPFSYYASKETKEEFLLEDAKKNLKTSSSYSILLMHTPIPIKENHQKLFHDYDLILSGHTHNGMMPSFLKGTSGIISPSKKWFPKEVRGHIKHQKTDVIITGGITKLSTSSRFFQYFNWLYSPEITVIDL